MATIKKEGIFLDENKIKELIKEVNDRIDLFHEYFDINYEEGIISIPYSCDIKELKVLDGVSFENGFDSYVNDFRFFHNIDEIKLSLYDKSQLSFTVSEGLAFNSQTESARFMFNNEELITKRDREHLSNKIKNFESILNGKVFEYEVDSDVAYEKLVPQNSSPYAILNKVGGMSYFSENLIELEDVAETTKNGVTYSCKNGVVKVSGTNTSDSSIFIVIPFKQEFILNGTYSNNWFKIKLGDGEEYARYEGTKDGAQQLIFVSNYVSNQTATATFENVTINKMVVPIGSGKTFNMEYRPMLVFGPTIPTEFKTYLEGIRNSAVTEINSNGANLLDLSGFNGSKNGISWYTENGRAYFSGTTTAGTFTTNIKLFLPKGTYTLKEFTNTSSFFFYVQESDSGNNRTLARVSCYTDSYNVNHTTKTFTTDRDWNCICYVYVNIKDTNVNGIVVSPMLVKGSTAPTEFKPHKQTITKQLPSELLNLTDYGLGLKGKINSVYHQYSNYIDFENKKYIRQVIKVKAKDLNWTIAAIGTQYERFRALPKPLGRINSFMVASKRYIAKHSGEVYRHVVDKSMAIENASVLVIYDSDFIGDLEGFKNYLIENEIEIIYPLIDPIVEDISELLKDTDEFIEVESLGTLTFENEYEQDVPSVITYQVKL